mgnify:FL=1
MAEWKYKMQIKRYLSDKDELTDQDCVDIATNMKNEVEAFIKNHPKMDDDMKMELADVAYMFEEASDVESIDNALGLLYDAGDFHRIWIG